MNKNWPIKIVDDFHDPIHILKEIESAIQDKFKPAIDKNTGWLGILLYDANPTEWNSSYNKIELNSLPLLKNFVYEKYDFKKVLRIYLYNLVPGSALHAHRDMEGNMLMGNIRTHFCLKTNESAFLIVDGIKFHLEPGKFASFSTSQLHNAENFGELDRYHLVIDIENSSKNSNFFPKKSFNLYLRLCMSSIFIGLLVIRDLFKNPLSIYKRIKVNLLIRIKKK